MADGGPINLSSKIAGRVIFSKSMPEVAEAGEDHRHTVFVASRDRFLIAHRTARLHQRRYARFRRFVHVVAEGKKGVRRQNGAFNAVARFRTAICTESIRLIWPAPTPITISSFANTMALLLRACRPPRRNGGRSSPSSLASALPPSSHPESRRPGRGRPASAPGRRRPHRAISALFRPPLPASRCAIGGHFSSTSAAL